MSLRDDLLKAAPEGVEYVYTERCADYDGMRYFWCAGQTWYIGTLGHPHARTIEDTWEALVTHGVDGAPAEELSRRFNAQYAMLEQWINELGLLEPWCKFFLEHCGHEPEEFVCSLTPQEQEDRPRLALEFLKAHFSGAAGEIQRLHGEVTRLAEIEASNQKIANWRTHQCSRPVPTEQELKELAGVDHLPTPEPDEPTKVIEPIEDHEPHYEALKRCPGSVGEPDIDLTENPGPGTDARYIAACCAKMKEITDDIIRATDEGMLKPPSDPWGEETDTRGYPQ